MYAVPDFFKHEFFREWEWAIFFFLIGVPQYSMISHQRPTSDIHKMRGVLKYRQFNFGKGGELLKSG